MSEIKVVTTEQLLRATKTAQHHDFTLRLSDALVERLDPLGHHTLGITIADQGNRARYGVPYYRCRALLALSGRLEPLEAVIDAPAVDWAEWSDGDAVIAALKASINLLGGAR
jgi:hypothetical protein